LTLRVAFAGTPEFALPALHALRAHHTVVGVLTQPDRPSGRGRHLSTSPVKHAALSGKLPLAQPHTLRDAAAHVLLEEWHPDVLVVVAYGLLVPRELLTLPRLGCINIHASLLPRWRGAAPIERAILAGDTETGVSIMQLDAGLDTGPVLLERRVRIGTHTAGSLRDELAGLGAAALIEALDGLEHGTLHGVPQPADGVSYAPRITKAEGLIDWTQDATTLERKVRAFNPWPIAETRLEGEQLRVLAARTVESPADRDELPRNEPINAGKSVDPGTILAVRGDEMTVACGRGVLAVTQLQRPGRRPLGVRDFAHAVALPGRRLG
jgi:methionyl-tRNA formyltransferase